MSKIVRKVAKIFGLNASTNQIAQFGSLAAGSPAYSTDPATIQALGNWLTGWFAGVEGASSPAIEDLNAFCYVMAYQMAYQMQQGVPEWDSATPYYLGSLATDGNGNIYLSRANNNLNNALNTASWKPFVALYDTGSGSVSGIQAPTLVTDQTITLPVVPTVSSSLQIGSTGAIITFTRTTGTTASLGGVGISLSSSSFSTSSNTYVDVTNLSTQITTSGRPVQLQLIADGNGAQASQLITSNASGAFISFNRAGTNLADIFFQAGSSSYVAPVTTHLDPVAAGTYTYKLQARTSAGSMSVLNFKLVAFEIS